jgi:hypothetical protein
LREQESRPLAHTGLLQRFADIATKIDRPIDIDELPVLTKHIEKLAKIPVWHHGLPKDGARPARASCSDREIGHQLV